MRWMRATGPSWAQLSGRAETAAELDMSCAPSILYACTRASGAPVIQRMAIFITILYTPSRRSFAQHGFRFRFGTTIQNKSKRKAVANVAIS